jgi:hypothetical protein
MKIRTIKINPEFLLEALKGKIAPSASNLPEDLELLNVKYDLFSEHMLAIVRSDSFDDIEEAYPVPEFKVVYTKQSKSETKPIKQIKSEPSTEKIGVQTNQEIRAVEEEFNPEQRELLSFTIDGDFVVIKPIQYLKDEWNEINDVVRSLGGKWIKGDFSSYWAIPLQQS